MTHKSGTEGGGQRCARCGAPAVGYLLDGPWLCRAHISTLASGGTVPSVKARKARNSTASSGGG